jgi:hypothetical protein
VRELFLLGQLYRTALGCEKSMSKNAFHSILAERTERLSERIERPTTSEGSEAVQGKNEAVVVFRYNVLR